MHRGACRGTVVGRQSWHDFSSCAAVCVLRGCAASLVLDNAFSWEPQSTLRWFMCFLCKLSKLWKWVRSSFTLLLWKWKLSGSGERPRKEPASGNLWIWVEHSSPGPGKNGYQWGALSEIERSLRRKTGSGQVCRPCSFPGCLILSASSPTEWGASPLLSIK